MNPVTAFVLGFFFGAFFGLCLMAVLTVSKRADQAMERMGREE